ncbi:MAG: PmoA family protein [Planctomycetaceae bacterium]
MPLPRCEIVPLAQREVSFLIDGVEVTRWNFGDHLPRPCFFPLNGPDSKRSLTRMGHPGAPNHDHHASVWFAHHKLLGIDFWGISATAIIRQSTWQVYADGDEAAVMAVQLHWLDGHDPTPLVEQQLIATLRPLDDGEYTLSLESTFTPRAASIEFQQTNFGFLAVRVAKSLSVHFGGGQLTNSEEAQGEPALFGQPARWVDYSGPMPVTDSDGSRDEQIEGITYFDHPENVGYPHKWHVRADGWMGASICFDGPIIITPEAPLHLRHLLHIHRGPVAADRANKLQKEWSARPAQRVIKSPAPHHQFEVVDAVDR